MKMKEKTVGFQELISDKQHDIFYEITTKYGYESSVRILYILHEGYELLASGSLININGTNYFITAAHCLFEKDKIILDSIGINAGVNGEVYPLIEKAIFKEIYIGNPNSREDDLAIFQVIIHPEDWKFYNVPSNILYLSEHLIEESAFYYGAAIGYPSNRNDKKKIKQRGNIQLARTDGAVYKSNNELIAHSNINIFKNIIFRRGVCKDVKQGTGPAVNPVGMSGGALFIMVNQICYMSGLLIWCDKFQKESYFIAISMSEIVNIINNSQQ